MTAKQRRGILRLLGEFIAVVGVVSAFGYAGNMIVLSRGYESVPALFKLREPIYSVFEIVIPMVMGAFMVRFFARRQKLTHVMWREPEYVSPDKGGKAPTYAPPLDTHDDLLMGSALSSEPEPFYDLHVQPRISRLWWLIGILASLGAVLIIIYGFAHTDVSLPGAITGMFGAFTWAFTQEYLLRGLVVAELRRLTRGNRSAVIGSMLLSVAWMFPISLTAATPTRMLVLILLGPLMSLPLFAIRRMFTTLWAPIIAQFLFISVFFVLV